MGVNPSQIVPVPTGSKQLLNLYASPRATLILRKPPFNLIQAHWPAGTNWMVYVCMYICMYICMYVYMYVCVHVCICYYIYVCLPVGGRSNRRLDNRPFRRGILFIWQWAQYS